MWGSRGLDPIPEAMGTKQGITLGGVPAYHRAHTPLTHTCTPIDNLETVVACFWTVQRNHKGKQMMPWGEHANFTHMESSQRFEPQSQC